MKKFLKITIVFLLGLVLLDFLSGFVFRYLVSHAKGGDTGLNNYICNEMKEECIIFGSSRGMHHYDPNIIGDSLGMSCWNCSLDGNGIILMYGRFKMMTERYTPKIIIYDVCSSFDLLEGDNHKYLGSLRYYYDRHGIDSIFWEVDKIERYKMMSNFYRYNSVWLQLFSDNIHPLQSDAKGYRPKDKRMEYTPELAAKNEAVEYKYDSHKLAFLEALINDCKTKGIKLVFSLSPMYNAPDDEVFRPLKMLSKKYNVPLINHYCDRQFAGYNEYFYDSVHMNRTGATKFSKIFVSEIKMLYLEHFQ